MLKRIVGASAALVLCLSALSARADEVVVFAAASLTNAVNDVGAAFTAKTGHSVKSSFAASSALAKQIEQGAPAHVFASADLKWMDYLTEKKLVNNDARFNLLGNTLVLVAPADSKVSAMTLTEKTDIAALAGSGRIATGNPDSVPVGLYFKKAMETAGQWAAVQPKVAAADSVRGALAFVERGEVPYGVVYGTDAAISSKIKVVGTFPDSLYGQIVYPFGQIAGKETAGSKAFLDFVQTNEAKGIFAKYGFKVR
ncbi:molybdate ABC transporter substrate-binding protein [Magnetospirillum sulfuroxidans]|uniref:Molybdate ABC transporter substrate-binding protein n=1 Tax=Magnetospirillum sulfuroxidans TaxID=611300 RepID=A0ABS5IFQ9_9PROT|nr:molybdate ABC transporter substrate-binding protein [Magnetospirillum sulfuroxidans]MBR9973255.1 molybdate ABC transporter substrate-binding protein [Magnetospirillum sulfuroxidans]